jgi:hypothetical protein
MSSGLAINISSLLPKMTIPTCLCHPSQFLTMIAAENVDYISLFRLSVVNNHNSGSGSIAYWYVRQLLTMGTRKES